MLSLEDRDLIKAYRAAGWTIQDIHEHTGFGRNTIKRVLDAKPPKFKPQSKAKTDAKTPGYRGKTVRVYRCKRCGNKVTLRPCLICEVKGP